MALVTTHAFVSAVADDASASAAGEVLPSHWNANHTISIATDLSPDSNDGAALGTSLKQWSDLFMASGGVLNWNNGNVTVTHSANLLYLNSTARVNVGSGGAGPSPQGAPARLLIECNHGTDWHAAFCAFGNNSGSAFNLFSKTRGANASTHSIVSSGDNLGIIEFDGSDGTNYVQGAYIRGQVDAAPGANSMPGRLGFYTTPSGSAASTERMRIDSGGKVSIGYNGNDPGGYTFSVAVDSATIASQFARFTNDGFGPTIASQKSRSATPGAHVIVSSGDIIGNWQFNASDGTNFITAAVIRALVDGTPGTNNMPGRLGFYTTPSGSAASTERMRIDNAGLVTIGAGTATGTLNAGALQVAGTGVALQGKQSVPVPAAAMTAATTNGAAPVTLEMATNKNMFVTFDFDPTTSQSVQFTMIMPISWDEGTVTFQPVWSHASASTNFGVAWELSGVAVSDTDAGDVAFGTGQTSIDTGGTTNTIYIGPESSAITIAGTPQPGDMVFFKVARLPANASDTLAVNGRLHGIRLNVTTAAGNDA